MPFGTAGACRKFVDDNAASGAKCFLANQADSSSLTASTEWDLTPPGTSTRGTVHVAKLTHTHNTAKPNHDVFFAEYDFTDGGKPYAQTSVSWFESDADKLNASFVGVSGSRSIVASSADASMCKVGGPEVGLMVDNRVDLDMETEKDIAMNYLAPINVAIGGWG